MVEKGEIDWVDDAETTSIVIVKHVSINQGLMTDIHERPS